jgi:outer membrane receptor for ferrienterochelin and colicin
LKIAKFSRIGPSLLWLAAATGGLAQPLPTASTFSEKLSDAAGVVTVVTQDELDRFGAGYRTPVVQGQPVFFGIEAWQT